MERIEKREIRRNYVSTVGRGQPLSRQLGAMNAANERRRDEQTKKPFQTRGGQWNLSVNRIDVRNSVREIDVTERRGE